MIPYGKQYIDKDDIKEVLKVLKSDFLTQGPKVKEFEEKLAEYCGVKYAVAISCGTAALHLAYLALGLKSNDEVITTPNTFVATSNMLLAVGAKPVFSDVTIDTYNIDESKIEKAVTKKTKAIVPVHFAGHSCDMVFINKIAKKYKLKVVEDACHALGAKYKNKKVGDCQYSDMAVFSFHPVKSITTGEGGAILTNNEEYYKKLIHLRSHGVIKDEKGKNVMTDLGYNYRITDFQCALGLTQLKKLDWFNERRHQVVEWYKEEFKDFDNIVLPTELPDYYSSWHIYIIRTKKADDRDELMEYLKQNDIGVNFHYPAVYSQPYYRENGYKDVYLKIMEEYQKTCITLPCHVHLKKEDIKYIVKTLKDFYAK